MLAYIMVGAKNIKRAAKFYNAALAPLGLVQTGMEDRYVGYGPKNAPAKSQFYVTKPYNKKPATFGNGTMIAFTAKSRKAVDGFYAAFFPGQLSRTLSKSFIWRVRPIRKGLLILPAAGMCAARKTNWSCFGRGSDE